MSIYWGRLLTKRDASFKRHIYGSFSFERKPTPYDSSTYDIYVFWGREGCTLNFRPVPRLWVSTSKKIKDGYVEISHEQLTGKWSDVKVQAEQFILMTLLKG
jgi:hypothetical protein